LLKIIILFFIIFVFLFGGNFFNRFGVGKEITWQGVDTTKWWVVSKNLLQI
jgi:hypothetical protein